MELTQIVLSLIPFLSTLAGGLVTLHLRGRGTHYFLAFSAGTLVAISFLDLLPEAAGMAMRNSVGLGLVFMTVLAGFLTYHLLEKLIHIHTHAHAAPHEENAVGILGGSALVFHSFLDGVAIGTAFQASFSLGMLIALAVILHDFSDGVNTVTIMLKSGAANRKTLLFLGLDAIAPVVGASATLLLSIPEYLLAFLLAWFVGEFLYLGATDLLPSAHKLQSSAKTIAATFAGVALIFVLTRFLTF